MSKSTLQAEEEIEEVDIKTNYGTDVQIERKRAFCTGTTVRLTEQAHILLSEKAEDYKTSMKAVASEAIFLLVQGEDRDKEIEAYRKHFKEASTKLQNRLPLYLAASAAIGTVGGIAIGLVL